MHKSTLFASASAALLLVAASSCREAAAPRQPAQGPDGPRFTVTGSQNAISGKGYWGAPAPGSGADRQDFDFTVSENLTGRVLFNEYLYSAWIKVDTTDAQTKITAFRNSSALCGTGADPANGAEVDGIGRREDGTLQNFTLVACDNGPANSGADFFKITFSSGGYVKQGNPPNGDIVKTIAQQAQTGNLNVTTTTTGSNLPSGYTVTLDANPGQSIGANATVSFNSIATGNHTVVLSGVPSNCTVSGSATQTATVTAGQTATAAYSVSCASTTGSLAVSTTTSGSSLPSGYSVSVDSGAGQPIGINATVTFNNLAAGNHTVVLSGVPSNCTVSGSATQTVAVTGGQTASAAYSVSCVTPTGNLNVTTSTSGSSLPSGYTVSVDGSNSQSIGINATVTFANLAAGSHTVALSGAPANCTVSGSATQSVTVTSGQTASASYAVSCVTPPGSIAVTTSTSGSSLPSGYTVSVDGQSRGVGINATTTFSALAPGSHTVVLSGVPANCTLSGSATQTVTVASGQTATASYAASCITPNTTPTVNAGPDQKVLLGLLYSLHWSFADPDNGPWRYTINWGDGSSSSGTATSAGSFSNGHTYILGTFTIRVTVTDSKGATASATKKLSVVTGLLGF